MVVLRSSFTTEGTTGGAGECLRRECHLVMGGGGYAGFHLGKALTERGHDVVLFDIKEPTEDLPDRTTFIVVFVILFISIYCQPKVDYVFETIKCRDFVAKTILGSINYCTYSIAQIIRTKNTWKIHAY